MVTNLNYYLLTKTVELVKLKLMICIKTFEKIKINFIVVIIQKTLIILTKETKRSLVNLKVKQQASLLLNLLD